MAATPPDWTSKLTAIATLATAVIALLALLGAIFQLRQNRNTARVERAHLYLQRYNEIQQIPYIVKMLAFMSLTGTPKGARITQWERMKLQDKLETVHALNFWEELAGMYNREQVDGEIVRDYFGPAALDIWALVSWFAAYRRGKDPRDLRQLEDMCVDIRRRNAQEQLPPYGGTGLFGR